MKKSKIIAIASSLAIIGLGVFAVIQLNSVHSSLSLIAVVLSLVPMYFLYAAVVMGKYDKNESQYNRDYTIEKKLQEMKRNGMKKPDSDYGKMLDFPKDKEKKDKK